MDETLGPEKGCDESSQSTVCFCLHGDFLRIVISTKRLCELFWLRTRGLVCTPSIHFERIGDMGKRQALKGKRRRLRNCERSGE
jgi:hypothetical protein